MSDDEDRDEIGWGRPPVATQFKPGVSGNPNGRPRGKRSTRPADIVLGQIVVVRENGRERKIRADAAFLLQLASKGLAGDSVLTRAALTAIGDRPTEAHHEKRRREIIFTTYADHGDLRHAARYAQIATILDPYRPTARLALEPWIVEEALARLGERQLSLPEQEVVFAATRTPHKVRWPAWWTVRCC